MKKKDRNLKNPRPVPADAGKTALRAAYAGIAVNGGLSLMKLCAGIFARSGAMVSDAAHSASDVFSSIIVIIGIKIAARESDPEHPYGHERFECVAALILCAVLLVIGIFIGRGAVSDIMNENREIPVPGLTALIAAAVSVIIKEGMFRYTRHHALRADSGALMADAWHHRSDALSSAGALVGVAGARIGYPILEPIASIIICVFILKAALDIFRDAVSKMVDKACSPEIVSAISRHVLNTEGVMSVSSIQTRVFASRIYADIEICADGNLSLQESHAIASNVHESIEGAFPKIKHISVNVKPFEDE